MAAGTHSAHSIERAAGAGTKLSSTTPNAPAAAEAHTPTPEETALKQWLISHGATFECVDWPVWLGNSRGVVATKDIDALEPMFTVPESLMMTPAAAAVALPDLGHAFFADQDHVVLSVFLMHERARGEASFWHPYIASLPGEPEGLMRWTPEVFFLLFPDVARGTRGS